MRWRSATPGTSLTPAPIERLADEVLTMPSRRRALLTAALGALYPKLWPVAASAAEPQGLAHVAAQRGILYGTLVTPQLLGRDPDYTRLVEREAAAITSWSTQWGWGQLERVQSQRDYSEIERLYSWAHARGMKFRGHNLIWSESAPPWFGELPDRASAVRAFEDGIAAVCGHFAGRFDAWIVVNEAIKISDRRPDRLRRTVYLDQLGPDYLDIAFRTARANDSTTPLLYNEFGLELDTPEEAEKRRVLLDLIDGFKKRGTPIDAIGLQSHLAIEDMRHFNEKIFSSFLDELVARGLKIAISELDVVDRGAPTDIAARDRAVAAVYRRYLDVALANRAVTTVISWGLTDRNSWITSGDDPSAVRADGMPPRPLPFDVDCLPKPAYVAIAEALNAAPSRKAG